MPMIRFLYLLLFSIAFALPLHAQSLRLFGIDDSGYPVMKAKFTAFDATWTQQSPSIPSLFLTENGIPRTITNVQCPPPQTPAVVSLAMSIDISSSMHSTVEWAKNTVAELCSLTVFPMSDFALQTCDDRALIVQDFTKDKTKITDALPGIVAEGGNDFTEHLLHRVTGLLNVAKNGTNKRFAVLFTDAWWFQLTPAELLECKRICDSNKIQFIAVIYSRPETEPNGIKLSLRELASHTGGMMYDGVYSKEDAIAIAAKIQIAAQGSVGDCDITWESGVFCSPEPATTINVALSWNGTPAKSSYELPLSSAASLSVTPNFISFGKIPPLAIADTILTVTAHNADFTLTNAIINVGSAIFSIVSPTFPVTIAANTSRQLTLRCAPIDSSLSYVSYQLLSDKCSVEFSANGGYGGVKSHTPTLRLTHPNGGEEFLVGADTVITWSGIAASDTVRLLYSIDNGTSWIKITDKATGHRTAWKDIPKPVSKRCLMKVQLKAGSVEPTGIEWLKTFGGSAGDRSFSVRQTNDGGYVLAGESESTDGDASAGKGMSDVWIIKLNALGTIEWKRRYGGSRSDGAHCIRQTLDGGYIVAGYSDSNDGDSKSTKGSRDAWILKLSKLGIIEWQKTIGGSKDDEILSIEQNTDGSYIAAGWSESSNGDIPINRGNADAWVMKFNPTGTLAWQYTYGGTNADFAESIVPTLDGGYIFAGHTYSQNGDITANHGLYDYWAVKIRSYGTLEWQKTYGGTGNEYAKSIRQLADSSYIVAGYSDSKNGDLTVNQGSTDAWLLKLSPVGMIQWQSSFGGSGSDYATSILPTVDGGFAMCGYTYSNDGDITGNRGGNDAWILKLGRTGSIEWQKTYGGSKGDVALSMQQTNDEGFVFTGTTDSKDADAIGNHGASDYWLVKLSSDGLLLQEDQSDRTFSIVAPSAIGRDIDLLQCVVGKYKDSLITDCIANTGSYPVRIDSLFFRGPDAAAFVLTSGIPPFTVPVSGAHAVEYRFIPTRPGIHRAQIIIVTQSDTVFQTIQGEGITPVLEVLGSFIDFGKVTLRTAKDTLRIAGVRALGSVPLTITGATHLGPNTRDFSTLSGGGSFILQPNDTAFFDLRFLPQDLGRTSGRIAVHYNGPGSPAILTLFGTGVLDGAHIRAQAPQFPRLICKQAANELLRIANAGQDTLRVSSVRITGTNASDFRLGSPFTGDVLVPPDSEGVVPVIFEPKTTGTAVAFLEIRSNSMDSDSVLVLPLKAVKDSAGMRVSMQRWDVGVLCPSESKDTTIVLSSTGTLPNVIRVSSVNLSPGTLSLTLFPGDSLRLPLRFPGGVPEGPFDEILTLTDSICSEQTEIHVTGMIQRTKIISQQLADFGSVAAGSSTLLDVYAVNKDTRPIVIESPTGFAAPFTLDALFPPAGSVLAPEDTVRARIRYNAISNGPATGYLNWSVILPCPSSDATELRGTGVARDTARTEVVVQNITAQAGEAVQLSLLMRRQSGMEILGAPTEWYARLRYNSSILFIPQPGNLCPGIADSCTVELTGNYHLQSDTLLSLPCITTLGNTDHSTIVIDTFYWTNSSIITDVATQNGSITLTGVCTDGGVRLFIPSKSNTSLATRPNPAQDNLFMYYGLREPLDVTIELMSLTGQVVKTIISHQVRAAGQYTLPADLSMLGNGVYVLRLTTNKEILTTRVDVVK